MTASDGKRKADPKIKVLVTAAFMSLKLSNFLTLANLASFALTIFLPRIHCAV